jgi:hypothetical protein
VIYTWEDIYESHDFDHGQQFVMLEDKLAAEEILKERIKIAEKAMRVLWSVSNFIDKPTLITETLSEYRKKYPIAIGAES